MARMPGASPSCTELSWSWAVGGSLAGRGSITWVREQLAAVLGQSLSTVSGSGGSSVE